MKHYLIYIDRSIVSDQIPLTDTRGRERLWLRTPHTYTLNVRDDENPDLTWVVNTIIAAERMVNPYEVQFWRAIVVKSDGSAPFDLNSTTHLFHYSTPINALFNAPHGTCQPFNFDDFIGVEMVSNRTEGLGYRRYAGQCLAYEDFRYYRNDPRDPDCLSIHATGPFLRWHFPAYQKILEMVPGIDTTHAIDRMGVVRELQPKTGPYLAAVPTDRRAARRNWERTNWREYEFRCNVLRALETIEHALLLYQGFMEKFNRRWGDGYVPPTWFWRGIPARAWYDCASILGYEINDTLDNTYRGQGGHISITNGPPITFKNPELVDQCIRHLYALEYWFKNDIPDEVWITPTPREEIDQWTDSYYKEQKIEECREYAQLLWEWWPLLTSYMYAVKNTLCILYVAGQIQFEKRPNPDYPDVQPAPEYPRNYSPRYWQREALDLLPSLITVFPANHGPFLTLDTEPITTASIYVPSAPLVAQNEPVGGAHNQTQDFVWTIENIIRQARTDYAQFDNQFGDITDWIYDRILWMIGKFEGAFIEKAAIYGLIFIINYLRDGDVKTALLEACEQAKSDYTGALHDYANPRHGGPKGDASFIEKIRDYIDNREENSTPPPPPTPDPPLGNGPRDYGGSDAGGGGGGAGVSW